MEFGTKELIGACARLTALLVWAFIAIAHLLLIDLLIAAMWWTHVTPEIVSTAFLDMLESKPIALAGLLGFSGATIATVYWKLIRWAHKLSGTGWLGRFVLGLGKRS